MPEHTEVQWYSSSGSGVRSWKLYGVTLVHLLRPHEDRLETFCGRLLPQKRSKMLIPDPNDKRCTQCARNARTYDMVVERPLNVLTD